MKPVIEKVWNLVNDRIQHATKQQINSKITNRVYTQITFRVKDAFSFESWGQLYDVIMDINNKRKFKK